MSQYLIQAAYTPEAWQALVKNPHSRKVKAPELLVRKPNGIGDSATVHWGQEIARAV